MYFVKKVFIKELKKYKLITHEYIMKYNLKVSIDFFINP